MGAIRERKTAKLLLETSPSEWEKGAPTYVFVAGKRRMVNLVGGGRKPGETSLQTLERETPEEIGISLDEVVDLERARDLDVKGSVITAHGELRIARWKLYTGRLAIHSSELQIPKSDDVTEIITGNAEAIVNHPRVSMLARGVLMLAHIEDEIQQTEQYLRAV